MPRKKSNEINDEKPKVIKRKMKSTEKTPLEEVAIEIPPLEEVAIEKPPL